MQWVLQKRTRWYRALSLVCIVTVLLMGTVQAVHWHSDNASSARHSCSICSTPHAKLNTAQTSAAPVMLAAPVARVEASSPRIFRPVTTNFVRPPPAA